MNSIYLSPYNLEQIFFKTKRGLDIYFLMTHHHIRHGQLGGTTPKMPDFHRT